MTDRQPPSWPPPPPPPPPPAGDGARPDRPSTSAPGGAPDRVRISLDAVRSPYGLVIALLSVAIFISPNLLVLAFEDLADGSGTTTAPQGAELVFGLVVTLVLQLVVFGLSLLPLLVAGRPFRRLFGPARAGALMWAIGLGVGIVTVIVTYAVNAVFVIGFGDGDAVEQDVLEFALAGGAATVLAVLLAVVFAPITEEVVFRGVLFRAMADRIGLWVGAVVSSAVFAVIHIEVVFSQPLALVGLFTVGLLLALAYQRTGSLVVPIVGHAVFNGVSISIAILADRLGLAAAWVPGHGLL